MTSFRLYKKERLCSPTAIEALFARTPDCSGALAYPLRAVWRCDSTRRSDAAVAFVIVVPKRRLRHAVDRVLMRRRIREAYRLHRHELELPAGTRIDIGFVFVGNNLEPYAAVERAMLRLFEKIAAAQAPASNEP